MVNYELLNVLIILGITLSVFAFLISLYFVFVLRKISILTKKLDYLIEDTTYKLEKISVVVDALVKSAGYIDTLETYIQKNTKNFIEYLADKREKMDDK